MGPPSADEPPSVARGGKDVIVVGCPTCRKRLYTIGQFMDYIARDVIPAVIRRAEIGE